MTATDWVEGIARMAAAEAIWNYAGELGPAEQLDRLTVLRRVLDESIAALTVDVEAEVAR